MFIRIAMMTVLLMGLFATAAWASDGHWYAGLKGGIGGGADAEDPGNTTDTKVGPAILGAVGYAFKSFRVEGEVSWRKNDFEDVSFQDPLTDGTFSKTDIEADLQNLAFMVNGAYDFHLNSRITPFVLIGLGVSNVEVKVKSTYMEPGESKQISKNEQDKTVFAYQAGAGVAYHVTDTVSLDVSYRFFSTPTVKFEEEFEGTEFNNTHHQGWVGISYAF